MASLVRAQPLLFPATARHTATVIFVHGLGDTGHGWAGAVENWRRRQRLDEVKFILPHAPAIPITCNWGMKMPGWYDIHTIDGNAESLRRNEDEAGILRSQAYFHELIQKEIDAGIPGDRIVLGGFSQGGAISIFAGLTSKVKLAGIVALSSYLLLSSKFLELVPKPEFNKETPIFMAHGDSDQVVNLELGKKSYELLKSMGYNVTLKIYEGMEHSACPEELDEVESFLRERLPALGNSDAKSEL
ncbi:Phospholipase/carboxylesterase/thioesterase [Corynascus novoguineensis]|uniref:Acyl-protein thioesterase 1 n=1 Tax=Corynascus novoguineensis TaxID=1126955 RepID=A0AAN7HQP8_9PEZI|nr:Phospholipase/carboxylesterase/thioesterase [Corynascus novoguineensis]